MTVLVPVPFTVTRYRCPLPACARTRSSKKAIAEHIERCWHNPAARACKTCVHYQPGVSEGDVGYLSEEHCAAGLPFPEDTVGRPTLAVGCPTWSATATERTTNP